MGDVVVMPGIERRDLCGSPVPDEQVLRAAIDLGIADVIVVGRRRDGSPYVAGATNDIDAAVGKLTSAIWLLTSGAYAQGDCSDDEPGADPA